MEILKKQEVNMKESKKTKGKIFISGEKETMRKSPENSPNPASFADLEERIKQIRPPVLEVPSALDQAVLDYARQKQKNRQRLHFVQRYVLGLAAAVAICAAIPILLEHLKFSQHSAANAVFAYQADEYSTLTTELLLLSGSIETSAENMKQAAAFSSVLDSYK